ncbi:hypothetical protein [Streptomyces sp. NPDC096324]|uniref:hypothetical protein n=1 Tax=Streptomyces sp. NPDC096324 TaxID=3366085 RepID=UPI00381F4B79
MGDPDPDASAGPGSGHRHRHADDSFECRKPDGVLWGGWIRLGAVLVVAPTWAALTVAFVVGDPLRH